MGAGEKRKHSVEEGEASAVATIPGDVALPVRYSKLVKLRETKPEMLLRDYIEESRREVSELRALCEEQKKTILTLSKNLKGQPAPWAANHVSASGDGPESAPAVKRRLRANVVVPSAEDEVEMLRILSGIASESTSMPAAGCFEWTVRNPAGDRWVRFTLSHSSKESSDPDDVIAYEPIEVQLPGSKPRNLVFMDGLDLDAKHASALLREILSHVLEKENGELAIPSLKKSERRRRLSLA